MSPLSPFPASNYPHHSFPDKGQGSCFVVTAKFLKILILTDCLLVFNLLYSYVSKDKAFIYLFNFADSSSDYISMNDI